MKKFSIISLLVAFLLTFGGQYSAVPAEAKTKQRGSISNNKSSGAAPKLTSMEFYCKPMSSGGQKGWYFCDDLAAKLKKNGFNYLKSENGVLYTSDDTPIKSNITYYTKDGLIVSDEKSANDSYGLYKVTIKFKTLQQVNAFISSVKAHHPESWTYQNKKIYALHWLVFTQNGLTIEITDGE